MRLHCGPASVSAWAALLLASAAAQGGNGVTMRVVAATGDQARGLAEGVTYLGFGLPTLNDLGQVAFIADVVGPGVDADNFVGAWRQEGAELRVFARAGDEAPGAGGDVFAMGMPTEMSARIPISRAGAFLLNSSYGDAGGATPSGQGVWVCTSGATTPVIMSGQSAPGMSAGIRIAGTTNLGQPPFNALSEDGRVQFSAETLGAPAQPFLPLRGLWEWRNGVYTLIAASGDPAPGGGVLQPNTPFNIASSSPSIVLCLIQGVGGGPSPSGIFRVDGPQQLTPYIRVGDAAPGAAAGATLSYIWPVESFADGVCAFGGWLSGAGYLSSVDQWVFRGRPGEWEVVMRSGEAPGAPAGSMASQLGGTFNAAGRALVQGKLTGAPFPGSALRQGLWREDAGGMTLVARTEGAVSGQPGLTFGQPDAPNGITFRGGKGINLGGQVVFGAHVRGAGVTQASSFALWVAEPSGVLRRLVGERDTLMVNGTARVVQTLDVDISAQDSGSGKSFGNRGHLAVHALFRDGTEAVLVFGVGATCPADVNGDGAVDFLDLNRVLSHFGSASQRVVVPGDANEDGVVDFADLGVVLAEFGEACGG